MIDIDKIEAAAKAATPGVWCRDFTRVTAKELGWDRVADTEFDNDSMVENATHIATANPSAVLEMVSMIRERDAVLRQALEVLQDNRPDIDRVERKAYMLGYYDPAIAAIKGVLKL